MKRFRVYFENGSYTEMSAEGWLDLAERLDDKGDLVRVEKIEKLEW